MKTLEHRPAAAQRQAAAPQPAVRPWTAMQRQQDLDRSPRMVAQRRALGAAFGPAASRAPLQRRLVTHQVKDDAGQDYVPDNSVGFINLYMGLLAEDTSVLVDGQPGGRRGLETVIKATEIEGAGAAGELADSLIGSGAWKEVGNAATRKRLAIHVRDAAGYDESVYALESDTDVDEFIDDTAGEFLDEAREWIVSELEALTKATTVGGVPAGIPIEWHADLAQIVYDQTKAKFYGESGFVANPYVPPFKKLITDINAGAVSKLSFVEKYGAAGKRGAEFVVDAPAGKKDAYDGKAVVHTHYANDGSPPNYAHTKPEAKKKELGFGYTVVDTGEVNKLDDTRKKWEDL